MTITPVRPALGLAFVLALAGGISPFAPPKSVLVASAERLTCVMASRGRRTGRTRRA